MTVPRTTRPIRVVVFDGESGKGMTVTIHPWTWELLASRPEPKGLISRLVAHSIAETIYRLRPELKPPQKPEPPKVTMLGDNERPLKWWERGQGLVEYVLILALIAIVAIVALVFVGGQISAALSDVGQSV